MRLKSTLLLLVLVLVLGAVILGLEKFLPATRDLAEVKRGPVKVVAGIVTQIDVESATGEGVTLGLEQGRWRVKRPIEDLADPERVARLLKEVESIGWIQRVHREEFDDAGWARTGLEKGRQRLRLFAGPQVVLECWVGGPAAIEGGRYLALQPKEGKGSPLAYVAKTNLAEWLGTTPKNWRDPKLVRVPATSVTGIKLSQPGGQIELSRGSQRGAWMMKKPLQTRASSEKVSELLSALLNLEIKETVESPNGAPNAKGTAGTEPNPSDLKISIAAEGKDLADIFVMKPARDAAQTKAWTSERKPVFTVMSKAFEELWSQPNDLRDRLLARIAEDKVTRIEIASEALPQINLRKEAESWLLQRHGQWAPANGDRVARFFEALNTQPIQEFMSDSASDPSLFGLANPKLTVAWWQDGSDKAAKLLIGRGYDNGPFFAKYEDEPSIYRIDASLLPMIPAESIRWKGLGALRFTQFALRRIVLRFGAAPPVVLGYDPTTAQWTGQTAERDITALIDRVKADRKASALAKLNVQDWVADRTAALEALANPSASVTISLGEPGTNTGPTSDVKLNFAPTQPGMETAFYFGQIQGDVDVFYLSRAALAELLAPVYKEN